MCGLFGFIGAHPRAEGDRDTLVLIAEEAGARGPHGWGISWSRFTGALLGAPAKPEVLRDAGAMNTAWPGLVWEAPLIVGHARMATSGDRHQVDQYQPIVVDELAVAHNGVAPDAFAIAAARGVTPPTPVDSAALAVVIATYRSPGELWTTIVQRALRAVEPVSSTALLVMVGGKGVVSLRLPGRSGRPGHPLYSLARAEGVYLCSRRPGPDWQEHPDDAALWWGQERSN